MRNDEVLERLQNLIGYMPQQKELIIATGIKQSNISTKKFRNSNWSDEEIEKSFKSSSDILEYNGNRDNLIFKGVRRVSDGS